MENPEIRDQWDEKYLRESPFMPFGSMMNAWSQAQKESVNLKEFKKVARQLFSLAQSFCQKALLSTQATIKEQNEPTIEPERPRDPREADEIISTNQF